MSVRVVTDTKFAGIAALAKRLEAGDHSVLVGVPKGATDADGTSLALVAAANEFGVPSKNIPERSAFRGGIRKNADAFKRLNIRNLVMIADGRLTIDQALGLLGLSGASAIKKEMVDGHFVPNAPATIRAKGSDKPWIDTGAVRQAVTYEIDHGQAGPGVVR